MPSRRLFYFILGLLSCLCVAFGPPVLTDSDAPRQALSPHQIRLMRQVPLPSVSAAAVLLADNRSGQILFTKNENERRAPASLTKIVTALVALQRGRQDQEIRVRNEDLRVYSVARLENGEKLTLRQLLFIMLIPSDNAAALAIARGVAGDVPTFVRWMNELVASWGLRNTHFVNPHGLDHKGQYSTAYDMAVIARRAMANPTFADIVRRSRERVAGHFLESTNKLLTTYPGTIGVKTGTTDQAGECLVTVVDRLHGQALCVVMGSQDRFRDTWLLLDYFYANFAELPVNLPETLQNRYLDEALVWHRLQLEQPFILLVKPWQLGMVSFYRRIDNLQANPSPDEPVGALEVRLGGKLLQEVPLYAR
ncbi:MAG: D-alanyl-D-alanine carboxypeptidase [Anaerolineae bacterium]|nr:D-alanyl-D-alanine carboxypeptidase [Anaerolineae bacterium]